MSDPDRRLSFFFSVAFVLSALTMTLLASSIMSFTASQGIDVLLPLAPWQQGLLVVLYILDCVLVLFITVFYSLAAMYGVLELRFLLRKLKQTRTRVPLPTDMSAHQHTAPSQQRRRGYRN